jgi:hypothetical protein
MSDGAGIALIAGGVVGLGLTVLVLRRRLPAAAVFCLSAAFSVAWGAGALVVQDHTTTADWVVTLAAFGLLGPVHARFLLGPFGPRRGEGIPATEPA